MARKTYVDPLLTQFSQGYRPLSHANEKILPPINVNKDTGKIAVYAASNLRIVTSFKSAEGETPLITQTTSIATGWTLEKHALKAFASDEEAENEDRPFNVRRDRAQLVMDLLSTGREYALVNTRGIFSPVSLSSY